MAGTDREAIIGGLAQNPTLFMRQKNSSLGVLAEDNVLQAAARSGPSRQQLQLRRKAFRPEASARSIVMEWTL